MTTPDDSAPWHQHRMVWLLIAIPALTVAGCLLTIYLAISSPDQLVNDPVVENNAATTER